MPKIGDSGVKTTPKRFTAVGAYVFAGGFTVGVKAAGFDVLCHLEGSPSYGVEVVRLNFPGLPVHEGYDDWPVGELSPKRGVDLVYGNPPCAAWSGNNPNSHVVGAWRDDPRVGCTYEHFSLLEKLRPKVWMWESVTQAPVKGRELVDELTAKAMRMGYSVTEVFHDAKDMGTPQSRKRWFMVAHMVELDFSEQFLLPEVPAVEALAEVRLKPGAKPAYDTERNDLLEGHLKSLRPGGRVRTLWESLNPESARVKKENGHTLGRIGFGHVRLRDTGPATATVGYAMAHPIEDRFLHVNEVQALAGFPQSYVFPQSNNGAKELDWIARGVCPTVGEWFARRVADGLSKNVKVITPKVRVVDLISPRSKKMAKPLVTNGGGKTVTAITKNSLKGRLGVPGSKPQDLSRRYDTTQLKENYHGNLVHRDYAAHFFRWGWASRFVESKKTRVLDVGCGQDLPLVKILAGSLSTVPASYVGVDLNSVQGTKIAWVKKIYDGFDFPGGGWETVREEQGEFDLVSCFEVIEHMHQEDGSALLQGIAGCLADGGRALVSTPVYNLKKMAANHIREYTVDELADLIVESGLEVVERFGTFASWNDIRRVCTDEERALLEETGRFYGGDVLACFLAPKYPDASRNNAWVLKRQGDA